MNGDLHRWLEYYQDLGFKQIYRREPAVIAAEPQHAASGIAISKPDVVTAPEPPVLASPEPVMEPVTVEPVVQETSPVAAVKQSAAPLPDLAPAGDTLEKIREDLGECRRCRLHEGRNKLVFGVGDPKARLVFVGEGPGADEDAQGIPFVGRAGQLLTAMIENTAAKEGIPLKRDDVYICNVVKCRPPDNRTPEPDEMEICGEFLFRQLSVLKPKAICALGGTAAKALTGRKEGVTRMRGKWFEWNGIPVMVTYHPSYLLRPYNQNAKREAWEDLKKALHFVYD
jgi:DNA polymerase